MKSSKTKYWVSKASCAAVMFALSNAALAADRELDDLLSEGKASEIVRVISERVALRSLTDEEQVLYGSALIDLGQLPKGTQLLETYVAINPQNTRAKLELARGYYLQGRLAESKIIFAEAKDQKTELPQTVRDSISRFERLIEQRQADLTFKYRPSIEVGLGYDDNINSGVNQPNITLPFFGPVLISPSGQAQKSSYQRVRFSLDASRPIDWQWSFIGAVGLEARRHTASDEFDSVNGNASAGLAYAAGANTFRTSLSYTNQRLGNALVRYIPNLAVDYNRQFDDWSLNTGINYGFQRYAGSQNVRDASYTNYSIGARYRLPFASQMAPALLANYTHGTENSKRTRQDLTKNSKSLRLGLELTPYVGGSLFGAVSRANASYNADDQFYGLSRADRSNALEIGLQHELTTTSSVLVTLASSRTSSNISLYTSKRNSFDISFRHLF